MSIFIVTHPKLYLKIDIDGKRKMIHAVKGTEVELTNKEAKSLVSKGRLTLKVGAEPKAVESVKPDETTEGDETEGTEQSESTETSDELKAAQTETKKTAKKGKK
jgi:hypothetical protein